MKNFNNGARFGGKKSFGNDRGFNKGARTERPMMHQAVCAECGKECQVPFRPVAGRPVFCSDCFGKKEDGGHDRFESRPSMRPSFGEKKMFRAVCDGCGKDCEVPFRPTGEKPVYCRDCFGKEGKPASAPVSHAAGSDQYKKQFEVLNNKLDSIMRMLGNGTVAEKAAKYVKPAVTEIKEFKKAEPKKAEGKKIASKKKTPVSKKGSKKTKSKK